MRAPRWSQISSLTWREGSIPLSLLPPTHIHTPGVCVLGSLPGPEGGISWGWLILCPCQTKELQEGDGQRLQESEQAPGVEDVALRA